MNKNFASLLEGAITKKNIDDSNIRSRIIINEEFKKLIPELSSEELRQLEENILKEGVRDPLILWPNSGQLILVDGHNRFSICQKHSLEFPFKEVQFRDKEDVKDWMIRNQLGRRNLSVEQISYLRGLRYNNEKGQGKRSDLTLDQNDLKSTLSTAELLAKEYNVGEATIKRDGEFAKALDIIANENPALREEILKGKSKLSKKDILSKAKDSNAKTESTKNQKFTSNDLASIAFEYIQKEKRSFDEIQLLLGCEINPLTPTQFFIKWKALIHNE